MSRIIMSILLTMATIMSAAGAAKAKSPQINRIDPPHWWAGMVSDTLQLMVYGPDIAGSEATLATYPGVSIAETVRLDSPNYLLIYLIIGIRKNHYIIWSNAFEYFRRIDRQIFKNATLFFSVIINKSQQFILGQCLALCPKRFCNLAGSP